MFDFESSTCRGVARGIYAEWLVLALLSPLKLHGMRPLSLCRLRRSLEPLFTDEDTPDPVDPCKAKKLREVIFQSGSLTYKCRRIDTLLKTVTADHRDLQRISIVVPHASNEAQERRAMIEGGETLRPGMQWSDLDRLLSSSGSHAQSV